MFKRKFEFVISFRSQLYPLVLLWSYLSVTLETVIRVAELGKALLLVFLDLLRLDVRVELNLVEADFFDAEAGEEEEYNDADPEAGQASRLPVPSVATVRRLHVGLDGVKDDEPEDHGVEVLDREAEVENASVLPPELLGRVFLLKAGKLAHGDADALNGAHEDIVVPFAEGALAGDERPRKDDDELDGDEDEHAIDLTVVGHADQAADGKNKPEAVEINPFGLLPVLAHGSGAVVVEHPADAEGLQEADEVQKVVGQVVVNCVKEDEAPVGTEEQGDAESDDAKGCCDDGAVRRVLHGVVDDGNRSFDHGEGGVEAKHEECQGQDEDPEVGCGHGVNGSGVGDEHKARAASSRHSVLELAQVANDAPDCEAGDKGDK